MNNFNTNTIVVTNDNNIPLQQPAKKDELKGRSSKSTGTSATGVSLGGSKISSRLQHGTTPPPVATAPKAETREASCQTLSTGDIVITKIFFKEEPDKKADKTLISSLKSNGQEVLVQQHVQA